MTQAVREMTMLSTSILNIKWTLRGKPKLPPASLLGGEVVLSVNSTYTLNQISGQVIEHEDEWDLAGSDPLAQAYFWTSRLAYSAVESGKDFSEMVKGVTKIFDKGKDENKSTYYPDPSGDPRKVMLLLRYLQPYQLLYHRFTSSSRLYTNSSSVLFVPHPNQSLPRKSPISSMIVSFIN